MSLALVFAMTVPVFAQAEKKAPAKPAAKKAAPAKKKDGAQSIWVKLCGKQTVAPKKAGDPPTQRELCSTQVESLDPLGRFHIVVRLAKVTSTKEQALEVSLPHLPIPVFARQKGAAKDAKPKQVGARSSSFIIPAGVRVKVDDDKDAIKLSFGACDPFGCLASAAVDDKVIKRLKSGKQIAIHAIDISGVAIPFQVLPLTGFTAAYDGKAIDAKTFADGRKALYQQIEANRRAALEQMRMQQEAAKDAAKKATPAKK